MCRISPEAAKQEAGVSMNAFVDSLCISAVINDLQEDVLQVTQFWTFCLQLIAARVTVAICEHDMLLLHL